MRHGIIAGVVGTSLIVSLSSSAVAQNPNPGNPSVLAAVQSLQSSVAAGFAALQTAIASLQTAVQALTPPAASNLRFTPPIFLSDNQGILCAVTNVATASRTIKVELIRQSGAVQSTFLSGNFPLDPGETSAGSIAPPAGPYYCRYTVLNGTRADIRGTAESLLGGGAIGVAVAAE